MRRSLPFLMLLTAWTSSVRIGAQKPESVSTPGLTWAQNLAAAHAESARDGKPVVAYFTFET